MSTRSIPSPNARAPRWFRFLMPLAAALAIGVSEARAGDEEVEEDAPAYNFNRSIAFTPLIFLGQLYANYEHLLAKRHGLLAEGGYNFFGPSSGSWAGALGYRYHFSPGLEGLFAGAFLKSGYLTSELEIDAEGTKTKYDVEGPQTTAGANLGYRWQWGNGVAATLRGGYGYPFLTDIEWSPDNGEDEGIKDFIEATFGLDLELTVGYSF